MSLAKKLLDFLFGKDPQIFGENGEVRHKLPIEKWQNWQDRFKDPHNDWRNHTGAKPSSSQQNHAKNSH